MQLTCPCLNITINVVDEVDDCVNESVVTLDNVKQQQQYGDELVNDPFFSSCERGDVAQHILGENGISEKVPILIGRRSISGNKWEIRGCLVCEADAYAVRTNTNGNGAGGGQVLVNTKLFIRDQSMIDELRKSPEISPVFQVILPKKATIPLSMDMNGHGYPNGVSPVMLSRTVLQSVQSCVNQYLTQQQEAMDERIRAYIDQQQTSFERLKANVKTEKATLLRFLAHNGAGNMSDSMNSNGTVDDGFDSAVPLSPLSAASGDPSPCLVASTTGPPLGTGMMNDALIQSPLRPKAMSNPASLAGWKRKRHSGGNSMAPGLASHAEEQQDIFTFDEQESLGFTAGQPDDGELVDEFIPGCDHMKLADFCDENIKSRPFSGSSLPYCAPAVCGYKPMDVAIPEMVQNNEPSLAEKPKDVGASMHALALSMKCPDDPERLFGERPQRRRWKTGEDRQQQCRQRNNSINYTATVVYANENQRNY